MCTFIYKFGEGQNYTIFTKIGNKLRQKLKYWDQIENREMTPGIIVTRDTTITAMWHDVSLTRGKFLILLKKFKKIKKKFKKN